MRFFEHQQAARARSLRLVALFALAVAATVLGIHFALLACWWLMNAWLPIELPLPRLFLSVNVGVTLLLVLGSWWIEASNLASPGAAQRLARRLGAREARRGDGAAEQRLCNIVDEVAIASHMPRPQVMVLPRVQAINALAIGMAETESVVMVTQGALDWLTRDELQGLVAHECSHIHEGDTRLNMQLAGMVGGLELVWRLGDDLREHTALGTLAGWAVMAVGSFGWWAGRALQAAVSRQRELLADARAVQWTRSRDGLGGVLRKALMQRQQPGATASDPAWSAALHHLLLVGTSERGGWFDSHPPLATRIRRLYGRTMPPLPLQSGLASGL
ncbi:M48 family metalloprotease [Ramlibacter sp. AN1015]|uniref:M48 family metalloprotease n=1 Tax=Ramlibacter sp. AN1015 TaxID=3133428 RepID=UPI0030BFA7D4